MSPKIHILEKPVCPSSFALVLEFSQPKESRAGTQGFSCSPVQCASCVLPCAPRQQLVQLVLEAPPARSLGSPGCQPEAEEVPGTDSSFSRDKVCTSSKAGGLAWAGQKSFKTEEHHDLHSASAELGGKDSKVISQEIPGCSQSHEKPSTSVLKGDKKGELFDFWLCPALSPSCGWLCVSEGPQDVALIPLLCGPALCWHIQLLPLQLARAAFTSLLCGTALLQKA